MNRKETLKENYKRLREAGFSSKEAARYKGATFENINKAIQEKKLPEIDIKKQSAGREPKSQAPKFDPRYEPKRFKGRITVAKATVSSDIKHLSNYTYVVRVLVQDIESEDLFWHKIYIQSEKLQTQKTILEKARNQTVGVIESSGTGKRVFEKTFRIEEVFINRGYKKRLLGA